MKERKILIVDDEAPIRTLLQTALSRAGYTVRAATGAEQALEILAQEQIPVMFIDLGLETMTGFELCETIREDSPDAVIYALSGHAGLFDRHDFEEAGFNGYDAKPIVLENVFKYAADAFEWLDQQDRRKSTAKVIKRILLIDDDNHFRTMLRIMLEQEGYTVTEASSGEEGCRLYSEQTSDLVITDMVMGGISGLDTALAIKEKSPEAKFIVVSGGDWYGADAEFEMSRSLGAMTLKKPFAHKDLLQAITHLQKQI